MQDGSERGGVVIRLEIKTINQNGDFRLGSRAEINLSRYLPGFHFFVERLQVLTETILVRMRYKFDDGLVVPNEIDVQAIRVSAQGFEWYTADPDSCGPFSTLSRQDFRLNLAGPEQAGDLCCNTGGKFGVEPSSNVVIHGYLLFSEVERFVPLIVFLKGPLCRLENYPCVMHATGRCFTRRTVPRNFRRICGSLRYLQITLSHIQPVHQPIPFGSHAYPHSFRGILA